MVCGIQTHLANMVDPPTSGDEYYVEVNGKTLQRALWDEACKLTQDGMLDVDEAKVQKYTCLSYYVCVLFGMHAFARVGLVCLKSVCYPVPTIRYRTHTSRY